MIELSRRRRMVSPWSCSNGESRLDSCGGRQHFLRPCLEPLHQCCCYRLSRPPVGQQYHQLSPRQLQWLRLRQRMTMMILQGVDGDAIPQERHACRHLGQCRGDSGALVGRALQQRQKSRPVNDTDETAFARILAEEKCMACHLTSCRLATQDAVARPERLSSLQAAAATGTDRIGRIVRTAAAGDVPILRGCQPTATSHLVHL